MDQFLKVVSPADAVAIVSGQLPKVSSEFVSAQSSLGRVLFDDVVTEIQLPEFETNSELTFGS